MPEDTKTASQEEKPKPAERATIISAVRTYLGFFVLIALIVEAVLGAVALKAQGQVQTYALFGMMILFVILIAVVALFAALNPEVLLRRIGSRPPAENKQLRDFCGRVSGWWLEKITPAKGSALSFVELRPDPATGALMMDGTAYDRTGAPIANWKTVASCINPNARTMFYYWTGLHPNRPKDPYEGFGEVNFHGSGKRFESGSGTFSDSNIKDMKSTTRKSVDFRRCSEAEVRVFQEGNEKDISDLVRRKLGLKR